MCCTGRRQSDLKPNHAGFKLLESAPRKVNFVKLGYCASHPPPHLIGSVFELYIQKALLSLFVKDFSLSSLKYLLNI